MMQGTSLACAGAFPPPKQTEFFPKPKGSLNKTTTEVKELLINILSNRIEALEHSLDALPNQRKVDALLKIAHLILPRPCIEENQFAEHWEDEEEAIIIQMHERDTDKHL